MTGDERWLRQQGGAGRFLLRLGALQAWIATLLLGLQAWLLAAVVNAVAFDHSTLQAQWPALLALLALLPLRALLQWGAAQAASQGAVRVKQAVRDRLFQRLRQLGPVWTGRHDQGALVTDLVDGVEALGGYFERYLPATFQVAAAPLTLLLFVAPRDWLSALILVATAPLVPFFMILIGKGAERRNQRQWRQLARMGARFLDLIRGLATLKLFGAAEAEADSVRQAADAYRRHTLSVLRVAFLSSFTLEFFATVSVAVVAVIVGFRLFWGELQFVDGFFVLLLAPEFYAPLRNLGSAYHDRMEALGAASRLAPVFEEDTPSRRNQHGAFANGGVGVGLKADLRGDESPEGADQRGASANGRVGVGLKADLRGDESPEGADQRGAFANGGAGVGLKADLRGVAFQHRQAGGIGLRFQAVDYYWPGGSQALEQLSLEIEAGERLAVVGPSGAGKSTLFLLLLGFIRPTSGRILVDDQPLEELDPASWRRHLAWIPQSPHLFSASVLDNIRLARPEASPAAVEEAAARAQCLDFISDLPQGFHTPIGEGGQGLSGGQRQRIALARAFLREAPLVLLDEPTAHLDLESEGRIQAAMDELAEGRTLITIAHRLQTVRKARRILVLENGRLAEQGEHRRLQAAGGLYQRLLEGVA